VTEKFGGKIDVETEPGRTRFVVRLPLVRPREGEKTNAKPN
jgi:signal transduction histidine kinase